MSKNLSISNNAPKEQLYIEILPQIESIISDEENLIANLANITAILNTTFSHLWTGFYLRDKDFLVLGPFQGPLACTRIPLKPEAKGVCGKSSEQQKTIIVPDVDVFPDHIACSSLSRSEIVVPLIDANGETALVLDIDSLKINNFDNLDAHYLEKIVMLITKQHFS